MLDSAAIAQLAELGATTRTWRRGLCVPPPRYRTPGAYVAAVRRIMARQGVPHCDGRLIAVGWRCLPPGRMVAILPRWLGAWHRHAPRPGVVGSAYNPPPDSLWAAWRRGVPSQWPAIQRYPAIRGAEAARVATALSRRISRELSVVLAVCSRRLLEALGRLSRELMLEALESIRPACLAGVAPLRVAHVDWPRVARLQAAIAADPSGRVRVAHATPGRARALAGVTCDRALAAWLAPAYPLSPVAYAQRVAMGQSPRQIAAGEGADLLPAEAHAWATAGFPPLAEWLLPVEARGRAVVRDVAVAQWVRRQWGTRSGRDALTLRRADGATRIDRVDELIDEDLRSGVAATFSAAALRAKTSHCRGVAICGNPWGVRTSRVRLLRTTTELHREGAEMSHCVGGYTAQVEQGDTYILSVRVGPHRSTAEVDRRGEVRQHKGRANSDPHPACVRALVAWQRLAAARVRGRGSP